MKRLIDNALLQWKNDRYRKPLLLRGARQVGKTHAARTLGATFSNFVEIDLDGMLEARTFFQGDLIPATILSKLSAFAHQEIIPGKTLLFLDEIQEEPRALTALRYFYEKMPELHVIAAGSLLDFAINAVGIPVGRVESLYLYPVSFFEFLVAKNHIMAQRILHHDINTSEDDTLHKKCLELLGEYLAFGGMPEALARWFDSSNPLECFKVHNAIIDTYRQDFGKYAQKHQVKYVESVFKHIPITMGRKFKFSEIEGEFRKRELAPAMDLLAIAGIVHKVHRSAGGGLPLGAEIDFSDFKTVFLDIALAQSMLGDQRGWILNPLEQFVNKGALLEAFVGQELLAYARQDRKADLFYWRRADRTLTAEIDYLKQKDACVIPVEVKSGAGTTLKSMHMFLESHLQSPYGIRFSTQNYSLFGQIYSYPLYAISVAVIDEEQKKQYAQLCT